MQEDQELIDTLFVELEAKDREIRSLRGTILEIMQLYSAKQDNVHAKYI